MRASSIFIVSKRLIDLELESIVSLMFMYDGKLDCSSELI
jgi:hypothetical protein